MITLPPLLSLKAFEAVARHKNIARAAEELCVTRSAVSQQIKQLEDYLGQHLIDRSNNKITLTPVAREYAKELSSFFQGLRFATRQLLESYGNHRVTLNLPTTYAMYWLIPKMQDFQDQHPEIDLRISTPMRSVRFETAEIDLAIVYGDGPWPDAHSDILFIEEWLPVCSPAYLSVCEKGEARYIEVNDSERKVAWSKWCEEYNKPMPLPTQILHVPHTLQAIQAALNGLGFACVPKSFVEKDIADGRLTLPFGDQSTRSPSAFHLLSPDTPKERPDVTKVREWLCDSTAPTRAPKFPPHFE